MEDQVPEDIKTERINRLLKVQEDITLQRNISLEGSVQEILIEGPSVTDPGMLMGRTRTNKIVTIRNVGDQEGTLLFVNIQRARHHSLDGTRIPG
jgi:tRNA-2-methylthio-N6-dimethylallyladenosine synthase